MPLRSVFFGTPIFAVPSLKAMIGSGIEVPLVVTQPDRPAGRHATPLLSPVAREAAARGIATIKPERLRGDAGIGEAIRASGADVGVVVAYGRILPRALLDLPRLGFVNVHASLLPRYRGASPVQAALLAGERQTGVVTMRVVEELDAGPIYLARRIAIEPRDDAGSLSARLADLGSELLIETLRGLENGTLAAKPQEGEPSFCRPIRREDGQVDWTLPATAIERRLRAFTPWPGLYTFLGKTRIKILEADPGPSGHSEQPGAVWAEAGALLAAAGGGTTLKLERVQRAGRMPVSGSDFALAAELPGRFGPAPA